MRKTLFGIGGLQVVGTIALVTMAAYIIGIAWPISLVIGMGVAMSSTAIGLTSLTEKKLLSTPGGQASFATLLSQDLSVIPIFMLLALLSPNNDKTGFDLWAVAKAIAVITVLIFASRTLLRPLMRIVA